MSTQVTITNYYGSRTNSTVEIVDTPANITDLEDWWADVVLPLTGDGKGESEDAIYEAVVTQSDIPELVGKHYQWG